MLYICIPAYDEAPTIGLVLWRIRKVFQEYPREYAVLVFDDGSKDGTGEVLKPYTEVLPLTVLGSGGGKGEGAAAGGERVGYARALDILLREAAAQTRYPRRDAVITMQGDFTDQPEHLPDLIKRFEGGADLVVADSPEQHAKADAKDEAPPPALPAAVRRLHALAPWALRRMARVAGVRDPFGTYRLYRVSLIRDLIKASADAPIVNGPRWAADLDLLARMAPMARRMEMVPVTPRYDLRPRASRIRPWADALSLYRYGRSVRQVRDAGRPG